MYFTLLVFIFVFLVTFTRCNRLPHILQDPPAKSADMVSVNKGPEVEYAVVKQINTSDIRPFRKRPANVIQYQIDLDNETFTITLRPNKKLFTPGCLIHYHTHDGEKDVVPCSQESVKCYYTGHSDVHNESWVAANVCNGLKGVLSFGNISLVIEPVTVNGSADVLHGNVHVVYRFQGDKQICPINDEPPEDDLHVVYGRKKRSVPTRYIKTRLVVDPTMFNYHKSRDNARNYTLMAFNIANKLYAHQSIGMKMQLTLSELHIIETYNDFASELTENAKKTLQTFCEWQSGLTTGKADHSVLLTRLDLEDDDGNSSVNGLAYLNQMCSKNLQNCALVEDEGPIVGITLAHEIGHLLGMTHDNVSNGVGIMSPGGWSGHEAFTWSNQSATELHRSITSGILTCLENRPYGSIENGMKFPLPGMIYTADQQCKMRNNDSYVFYGSRYSKDDPCRNIKCKFQGSQAQVLSSPLLDGTDCNNTRMWCMNGECVAIDVQHSSVAPVDGEWSSWASAYSPCSRSCGGGVQIKRRFCNNPPPQYGGNGCPGPVFKEKMCNMEACNSDYRSLQCAIINDTLGLVPALGYKGDESCIFSCQSDEYSMSSHEYYAEGTECLLDQAEPFSRCANGKCQAFGCDGYSDSGLKYDECGVCNGTGSSCIQRSGTYNEDDSPDKYTDVITIPAGSSGIRIQERNAYCFLSMLVDGKRILNTRKTQSESAVFNLYGIQFRYISRPETIEILGKITKDIVIQVFRQYDYRVYVSVSPDISYTYHTPSPEAHQQYAWAEIPNESCSRSCGKGEKSQEIKCMSSSGKYVDDYHCGIEMKPKIKLSSCNTQPCPPSWKTSEWGPCSVPCGEGTKLREVTCVSMMDGVDQVILSDQCNASLKPHSLSRCLNMCGWRSGNWSKCSRTCGEGYRTREVSCFRCNGVDTPIENKLCNQTSRPDDTERCRHGPCYVLDGTCVDKIPDCQKYYQYEKTSCDGSYRNWMLTNCARTCGVCGNGSCVDEEICRRVLPGIDTCHHPQYALWMQTHCPKSCNICRDCADCSKYDVKFCKDSTYEIYMGKYCRKTCKFC